MSHTPGPWSVVPRLHEESLCAVMGADGHLVVNLGDGGNGIETQRSNAALIAAAPEMQYEIDRLRALNAEMLEALKFLRIGSNNETLSDRAVDIVDAAIAKAEPQGQKAQKEKP